MEGLGLDALERYFQAYRQTAEFQPAVHMLLSLAASELQMAKDLLPILLKRSPDSPRVHRLNLQYLQYRGGRLTWELALEGARLRFGEEAFPTSDGEAGAGPA